LRKSLARELETRKLAHEDCQRRRCRSAQTGSSLGESNACSGCVRASTRGAIGRGSTSARAPPIRREGALSLSASAKATPCRGAETPDCSSRTKDVRRKRARLRAPDISELSRTGSASPTRPALQSTMLPVPQFWYLTSLRHPRARGRRAGNTKLPASPEIRLRAERKGNCCRRGTSRTQTSINEVGGSAVSPPKETLSDHCITRD